MLRSLQKIFLTLVDRIESDRTPIARYFLLFAAILSIRLTLEFFSSHRLFRWEDVLHISAWFAGIVLAFLLQLHLFSRVSIDKAARLSVVGFTIALTAPMIDLIVSGGQGAKMNYLAINRLSDLFWAYVTMGGASLTRGATLGIRIEIALLVFASANYIYAKRRALLPAVLGAWCIYTVLFISGTVPKILGGIVNAFALKYASDDQSTLLLLLNIDLALVLIACWRYAPASFRAKAAGLPWGLMALGAGFFAFGALMARAQYPDNWQLTPTTLFHFPLLGGLALTIGMLIGMGDKPRATPLVANALLMLCAVIGAVIGTHILFGVLGIWGVLFLYFEPPLRLGKIILLRQLLTALGIALVTLTGFMFVGAPMVGFPLPYLLTLIIGAALVAFGVENREGQPQEQSPTAPRLWWQAPSQLHERLHRMAFGTGLLLPSFLLWVSDLPGDFALAFVCVANLCMVAYVIRVIRLQFLLLLILLSFAFAFSPLMFR